ncbi:hypothetical protein [Nocardiopsis sp. CA-288880]|uniref:hypothetical protein n=1 Tax=Nocardiopsis sp. CA-288880 TaxID=3239995 RepID=UPI003D994AA0
MRDYTFGQRVCFLWRTADTAADWKKHRQLTTAHVSSAAVTGLQGKLASAREYKALILEYGLARSYTEPTALPAL